MTTAALITHDIQEHDHCEFNAFLTHFLQSCLDDRTNVMPDQLLDSCLKVILPVCNDTNTLNMVAEYLSASCTEVEVKTDRYPGFIKLFNSIFAKLDTLQTQDLGTGTLELLGFREPSASKVMFHRTDLKDPELWEDEDDDDARTRRQMPDIGLIPFDSAVSASETKNGEAEEEIYDGAQKLAFSPFDWPDYLAPLEFRLHDKTLDSPPAVYVVKASQVIPCEPDVRNTPSTRPKLPLDNGAKPAEATKATHLDELYLSDEMVEDCRCDYLSGPCCSLHESFFKERRANCGYYARPGLSPQVQNAFYGAGMLCRGIYATHAITLLIVDDVIWLWWFDRQGAIQSTGINFIQDLPYFVALLVAFQRFALKDWGLARDLVVNPAKLYMTSPIEIAFPQQNRAIKFNPRGFINRFSLVGRGTRVFSATGSFSKDGTSKAGESYKGRDLYGMNLVLKSYWPELAGINEADVLIQAEQIDDARVQGHIPELIAFKDFDYSTGTIRDSLGLTAGQGGSSRTPRVLRFLVFKYLYPIFLSGIKRRPRAPDGSTIVLTDMSVFVPLWRQWYQCHRALWNKGIKHGDISIWNLMYNDDTGLGVLNDFDLASLIGKPATRPTGALGTVPFMALALLCDEYYKGQIKRLYCHDLEAFVWVLFWVIFESQGTEEHRKLIAEWKTSAYEECARSKHFFLLGRYASERYFGGREGQKEWELARALYLWLAAQYTIGAPTRTEEEVFAEFEGIVRSKWAW